MLSHEKLEKLVIESKKYLAKNVFSIREHIYDDILWHPYHFKVGRQK